jgi:uncharacterized protein YrzB (UPF0473 family)
MQIPESITLEDVDGNSVAIAVIGAGDVDMAGERRIYVALVPEESWDGDEDSVALVVR